MTDVKTVRTWEHLRDKAILNNMKLTTSSEGFVVTIEGWEDEQFGFKNLHDLQTFLWGFGMGKTLKKCSEIKE